MHVAKTNRVIRDSPTEELLNPRRKKRLRIDSESLEVPKIRNINELPVELLVKIFSYVICSDGDVAKMKNLSLVCRHWAHICSSSNECLWKRVNLSEKKINLDRFTGWIASRQIVSICDLNVSGVGEMRNYHLETILKWSAASVKRLDVSSCKKLNADALKIIAEHVPQLEALNIANINVNLGQKNCAALFGQLKSLRHLNLSNNKLPKGTLKTILESCCNLESLDISRCFANSKFELDAFFGTCRNLKKLVVANEDSSISFDVPKKIDLNKYCLKSLEEIYFENSSKTYNFVNFIKMFCQESPQLKVISIRGYRSDETSVDSVYESIGAKQLQSLSMSSVAINVADLFAICALLNKNANTIVHLDFSWCRLSEDNLSFLVDFFIEKQAAFKLTKINLSGTSVDMVMFRKLVRNLKCLTEINLSSCRKLDRGLKRNIVLDELGLSTLQELLNIN